MSSTTGQTREPNRSYRDVLRHRRVSGLLFGDLLARVGTGMIIVAMPVQTLQIHGSIRPAIAIGMVEAAPFILSTVLALSIGLGRVKVVPRTLLIADCVLRSATFAGLGLLAVTERLTLPVLIGGLLFGTTFRMAGSSSRRVLATSMVNESERFAVNGLLGLNSTVALLVLGPIVGGRAGGPDRQAAPRSAGAPVRCGSPCPRGTAARSAVGRGAAYSPVRSWWW